EEEETVAAGDREGEARPQALGREGRGDRERAERDEEEIAVRDPDPNVDQVQVWGEQDRGRREPEEEILPASERVAERADQRGREEIGEGEQSQADAPADRGKVVEEREVGRDEDQLQVLEQHHRQKGRERPEMLPGRRRRAAP